MIKGNAYRIIDGPGVTARLAHGALRPPRVARIVQEAYKQQEAQGPGAVRHSLPRSHGVCDTPGLSVFFLLQNVRR